ncbi:adenylate/guanylate cyclase domain-containing protein [Prauserella halophila]|uniref:Adenylate/guanylate cyclase domain-containing protein n=1 Tax=Prauserella halophila TaxID=185641 RepID=A0ABN1WAJ0_9PSEU|nr:adenylate/guanylate cyclase domain-containing protein [Prauserella halophila]MCP2234663.1 Adenylate cyclase, class 3 [Prauserella halophila]
MDEALARRLERLLLDGKRKYTRLQVAEKAGVPAERTKQLWRALGLATAADDDVVFTDADVEAVHIVDRLVTAGLLDEELETSVARAVGLHLSRLAEWQADLLWSMIADNPKLAGDQRRIGKLVESVLPELEQVQNFVWRRHLAAYSARLLTTADEEPESRTEVVGFADMVGYTRMTRRVDEAELSAVLDRFESLASDIIADRHGRIVKMIGDEVLFVCDEPADAAEIALTLSERAGEDDELPHVRVGMAAGRVLGRFGDVYGQVVNLASRLTSLARPGTVLVDRDLGRDLAGFDDYDVRSRRSTSVRGYSRLRPGVLRRAGTARRMPGGQQFAADLLGLNRPDDADRDD